MSYVQRFQPKGNDLEVLRFFRSQRLSKLYNDPSDQQLVEQQAYDVARETLGAPAGGVTTMDLERAFQSLQKARDTEQQRTQAQSAEPGSDLGFPRTPLVPAPGDVASRLVPFRTGQQSRLEHRTPTRHMHTEDATADAIGAGIYHLIDSATLGVLGFAGGLLKKLGATDENFWTEGVGETEEFMGMDFGKSGIRGADSTAGLWAAGAGEILGFVGPSAGKVILKPAAKAIKGLVAAARAGKAAKLSQKLTAGEIAKDLVPQTEKLIRALRAGKAADIAKAGTEAGQKVGKAVAGTRIVEAGKKIDKAQEAIWKVMPARFVFSKGHKWANRIYQGSGGQKMAARVMSRAFKDNKVFDVLLNPARQAAVKAATAKAIDTGIQAGYATARGSTRELLASGVEKGILGNSAVNAQARHAFQREFIKNMSKNPEFAKRPDILSRLTENATGLFDDAWRASRKSGDLLTLAERSAAAGKTGMFSHGARKAVEDASSHVINMLLLGAATRLTHPMAEPDLFGLEDAGWGELAKETGKYWLRGNPEGNPLFEGVIGDIWVGSMFGTGGGTKLFRAFQKRRVANPGEVFSTILGGTPKGWSRVLDRTDRTLGAIYRMAPTKNENIGSVKRFLARNKIDFTQLRPEELKIVSENYLRFLEEGGMKYVPGLARGAAPFTRAEIRAFSKYDTRTAIAGDPVAQKAINLVEGKMAKHLDEVLGAYKKNMLGNLARDLGAFSLTAMATAYTSSPKLFHDYAKGHPDSHLSHLVTHSIFSLMAARHPYYLPDAPAILGKGRSPDNPLSDGFQTQVKLNGLRNSLRQLGIRDSAYFLEGDKVDHGPESAYGSRESTEDLNRIADRIVNELEQKRDLGEAPNWNDLEIVPTINDVTSPHTQISEREVKSILNYVKGEIARGADVHPMFLELDSEEKRYLIDSVEIFAGGGPGDRSTLEGREYLQKIVATGIEMKRGLVEKGIVEEGQELHHRDLRNANVEWGRQWVDTIRKVLDGDSGLLETMRRHLDDGSANEWLRKISIVEKLDTGEHVIPDDRDTADTVRAWNEIVDLANNLNYKAKSHINPRELRLDEPGMGEIFEAITNTIKWFEGEVNKASGLKGDQSFILGRGYLEKSINEALRAAKVNDATHFLDDGVLRNSDNEAFTIENVLDYFVDNGFAYRAGRNIVLKDYDLSGVEDPKLRNRLYNLLRYVASHKRVRKSTIREGMLEADDLVRMKRELEIGQAHGVGQKVTTKNIFQVLDSIGIPTFSSGHMDGILFEAARGRTDGLQEHDWIIHEMNKANALLVEQGTGKRVTPILIPKDSPRPKGDRIGLGEEFAEPSFAEERTVNWTAEDMKQVAEAVGRDDLKLAFSEEAMRVWSESNQRLTDAGFYVGWASEPMHIEGADVVDRGVFALFGEGSNTKSLEAMARTLNDIATKDRGAIETEMGNALAKMRAYSEDRSKSRRSRHNVRKLLRSMQNVRKMGGWAYHRVLMDMVDEGFLKMGHGFKAKSFKIPSTSEARMMSERLDRFIAASNTAITFGRIAADRAADPAAMEAFELIRKGRPNKINPSNMLNDIGLSSHLGMATGISRIVEVHQRAVSGEIHPSQIADGVREALIETVKGYGYSDRLDVNVDRINSYRNNEILAMTSALANSDEVLHWRFGDVRKIESVPLTASPDGAAPERLDLAKTHVGADVGRNRVPRKFWGEIHRNVAPIHSVDSTVPDNRNFRVDTYLEKNRLLREGLEKAAWRGAPGVEKAADGTVVRHDGKRLVILTRASEEGGYVAPEMPTDATLSIDGELTNRGKMVFEINRILGIYGKTSNADLNEALDTLRAYRDVIADTEILDLNPFYDGLESPGETARYGNRLRMAKTVMEMIFYDRMFGSILVKESMNRASNPHHVNELSQLKAREKLVIADSIQGIDSVMAAAQLHDFMKTTGKSMSELESAGITERGIKTATFDDVSLGKEQGRGLLDGETGTGSPTTDSAIWVTPETMQLIHHMFGRNTIDNIFGVGKLKFMIIGPDGGIYGSKDALFRNPHITKVMNANGLGMIASRSALKLLSGAFASERHTVKFADGSKDMLDVVQKKGDLKLDSEHIELPFDSIDWQYEVDHNPDRAIIAANMTNYKDPEVVKGMTSRFFEQTINRLQPTWEAMFGNSFSPESTSALRELMIYELRRGEGNPDEIRKVGWYMDYLSRGGNIASPNDFGMHEKALQSAMSSFIRDTMFKGRSKYGTHAVYAPDVLGTIRPGEAVLPAQASRIVLDGDAIQNLTIAYDRSDLREAGDAKGIEAINAKYWRWKEDEAHQNTRASEQVPEQKPVYHESVSFFGMGAENGLGPGIMHMWRNSGKGAKAELIGIRTGRIPTLLRLASNEADARRLAAAVNDAYQELVLSDSFEQGAIDAKAAVAKALKTEAKPSGASIIQTKEGYEWSDGEGRSGLVRFADFKDDPALGPIEERAYGEAKHNATASSGQWETQKKFIEEYDRKAAEAAGDFVWGEEGNRKKLTADSVANAILEDLGRVWETTRGVTGRNAIPQEITMGSLMEGLSHIFGKYDYDSGRSGDVDFGFMAGSQRNPTSLPNDMVPLMVRGFLDEGYGPQALLSHWDAERIMKADFDKDEINFWFDNPRSVISGMQRIRGISGGFHEPLMPKVTDFRPFTTQTRESSHNLWVQRFREGKMAVGIIQRAVNTVSTMINKGIAFEYFDPGEQKTYVIEPLGDMKTIQSSHQGAMLETAELVNRFFDVKKGVPEESITDMDLQRIILEKFYVAKPKDVGGSGSAIGHIPDHAIEVLKAKMSLFSNMAGVSSKQSRFSKDFDTLARTAARYSVVMQGTNPAANLANYTKLALALAHPQGKERRPYIDGFFALDSVDQRRIDVKARGELKQIFDSLRVINPTWAKKNMIKTEAMTDLIARSVKGFAGAIELGYEKSYMSSLENEVIKSALNLSKGWDESLKAAQGQAWVLNNDGQRGAIKELRRGMEYGEDHLAYEAAMSELEFRQYRFWDERNAESKFGEQQRWQPTNGLEYRKAVNETADGLAVNLARSMVDDLNPTQAYPRFESSMEIREHYNRRWSEIMRSSGRPSLTAPTKETLEAEIDVMVYDYMKRFGQGNEVAAMLDLVAPTPFGFYYARGNQMTRYKKFPGIIWRAAVKYGIPKTAVGPIEKTPEISDLSSSHVYSLLASSRALVSRSLDGDRHGLNHIRAWIEARESDGRSFSAALNLSQIGGYPNRFKRMRENLFVNMANSEMKDIMAMRAREEENDMDYQGQRTPEPEIGIKSPRDAESLIYEATRGDMPSIQRLKVLRSRQISSGLWPSRLLNGIDPSDHLVMKMVNFEPTARPGFFTSKSFSRSKAEVYKENRAEAKAKGVKAPKLSKDDVTKRIQQKEKKLLELLRKTLDARYVDGDMAQEGIDGSSMSRLQARLEYEKRCN